MNVKDILPAGIKYKNNDNNLLDTDFTDLTNNLLVKYGSIASRPGYFSLSYSLLYNAIRFRGLITPEDNVIFKKNKPVTGDLLNLIEKHTTKVTIGGKDYYDYPEVLYFNSSQYRYNKDDTSGNSLNNETNELFVDTQINGLKTGTDIKFLNLLGLEDDKNTASVFNDGQTADKAKITESFRNIGCLNGFCQFGNPLNTNFNPEKIFGDTISDLTPGNGAEEKSTSKTKCGQIFNTAEGTSFMRTYYTQGNICIDILKKEVPAHQSRDLQFFYKCRIRSKCKQYMYFMHIL